MSLIELAFDQKKNRYLQQRISKIKADGNDQELRYMFHQMLPDAARMACNEYANFVLQRLLENVSQELLSVVIEHIKKEIFTLATHPYACRVLQIILQYSSKQGRLTLANHLLPDVEELLMNNYGCYVLQKVVETVDPTKLQSLMDDIIVPRCFDLCVNKTSTRVIQEMFRYYSPPHKAKLTEKVIEYLVDLSMDPYGNYVVEKMVHYGTMDTRNRIVETLVPKLIFLACTKTGSNILEKCLVKLNNEQKVKLIQPLVDNPDRLATMIRDQYGNYVIQQIVNSIPYRHRGEFCNAIRTHFSCQSLTDMTRYEAFVYNRVKDIL